MYSEFGISGAMRALGVTWDTVAAWEASCKRILGLLEDHLKVGLLTESGRALKNEKSDQQSDDVFLPIQGSKAQLAT